MITIQLYIFKYFEKPLTSIADRKCVTNEVSKES